jgi:predicted O-linked N-acetylglucosamine transferase (SPINDLY family)
MSTEAETFKNQGNAHRAAGDLDEARASYRRALQVDPNYPAALYNLGALLQETGRFGDAEQCFRRLSALDRKDRDALFRLGLVLAAQGRHADAAEAYEETLGLDPANPLLWLELANARKALGQGDAAIHCLSRALEIEPKLSEAHNVLGMLLQDEGSLDQAIEHYRSATALGTTEAAYFNNLGCALGLKGSLDEAVSSLRRAIELQPKDVHAHRNLAEIYGLQGRRDLAARSFAAAYELSPDDPRAAADLLFGMQYLCDWSRFDELCRARRASLYAPEARTDPFSLLSIPSTRSEQLACARSHARGINALVAADRDALGFAFSRRPGKKLRIGYLSADLHEHATAHWTAELFELHDRERFEVVAYSYGPDDGSPMRARLRRAFDRFVDVSLLSHAEAARTIHGDQIDILIDLKGYTTNARTQITALRPAPIQVSFVGYPSTMGADFIDYLVGDRIVTPPEHAADYSEKLVRVTGCYQVNDRKRAVGETPSRRELGLPEQRMVFFCFNQSYKILPDTFASWMRILVAAPQSVLWLLDWHPDATRNLRREAADRGIDPQRLVFAPLLPHRQHLGRIAAADLLLDTLPYNAHTVASDALWCGVPVLTRPGETFPSRVAASQLTAVGMPELIAPSVSEYEAIATRLAHDRAEVDALRKKLARNKASCALFYTPAFVRDLEKAFERMWRTYIAGHPPAAIDL